MATSGEETATNVGLKVLRAGGNAVDAAVAMGFALCVTHSGMCGLGGGGYLLVRMADGRQDFYDFRERAPANVSSEALKEVRGGTSKHSEPSVRSAGVPGTVKGFEASHMAHGTKTWRELLEPAIDLAANGRRVTVLQARSFRDAAGLGLDTESRRIFTRNGKYFEAGDILHQPELARTLERIALLGSEDFYEGQTAHQLAAEIAAQDGIITQGDLAEYRVARHAPLNGRYCGYEVITAAGSSAGGLGLLQMLGVLEHSGYDKSGAGSSLAIHYMAEAMRRFFADCSQHLGDPTFVTVPVEGLLGKAHIAALRQSIDRAHATPSEQVRPWGDQVSGNAETTHFSLVDTWGNAVAVTFSLNSEFGSGITVPGLGFLLNNHLDNFRSILGASNRYGLKPGQANALAPPRRPISFMTPTIILEDGALFMLLGTPGGPTIPNSVLQVFVNVVDFGMTPEDAVASPRFHHQWFPDRLILEPGFSPNVVRQLEARGHEIEIRASNNDVNMILLAKDSIYGVVDPRREGTASGY